MRRALAPMVLASAALGCGAPKSTTPVEAPVSPPVANAETTATPARQTLQISGQVRAHDGSALKKAEVIVSRDGFMEPVMRVDLDAEGRFEVELPRDKLYRISLAAVNHAQRWTYVWLDDDVRVDGKLGTYARGEPGETIGIRSEWLDADGDKLGSGPDEAKRTTAPQHYALALGDRPDGAVSLRYQLRAPGGGRTYNGPLADHFESDGGGDYWSVVAPDARSVLELDLSQLPAGGEKGDLQWTGLDPAIEAILKLQWKWQQQLQTLHERLTKEHGRSPAMADALRTEARALATEALQEVDAYEDDRTRALVHAQHIGQFSAWTRDPNDKDAFAPDLVAAVRALEPTDPALAIILNFDNRLWDVMQHGDEAGVAVLEPWLLARARDNPSPSAASAALNLLLSMAERQGDQARIEELYAITERPQYEGTYDQKFIAERYDPTRTLRPGGKLPAYAFAGLEDAAKTVRSDDRDRLYLLEFWATWCGPCVNEQPKLHAAYAAINGLGTDLPPKKLMRLKAAKNPKVEFVFVSLDGSRSDVAKFRDEHWPMPWTHAFVGRDGEKALMDEFGFHAVPTAVLVDADGTILATGMELRREQLLPTLQRAVAKKSP